MARANLRVITEQGEVLPQCPECRGHEAAMTELQRKLNGMARELGELRKDRDAEAREHEVWPKLIALFDYWKGLTGHRRARWTSDRFWCALPHYKSFGAANLAAGIAGLAYDHYTRQSKNGKWEAFDLWETLFKDTAAVERYIKRRPEDWQLPKEFEG